MKEQRSSLQKRGVTRCRHLRVKEVRNALQPRLVTLCSSRMRDSQGSKIYQSLAPCLQGLIIGPNIEGNVSGVTETIPQIPTKVLSRIWLVQQCSSKFPVIASNVVKLQRILCSKFAAQCDTMKSLPKRWLEHQRLPGDVSSVRENPLLTIFTALTSCNFSSVQRIV